MIDTSGLNTACLGAFGESLTFASGEDSESVTGVVTRPRQPVATQAQQQNALLPSVLGPDDLLIELRTSDYIATDIGRGWTTSIDSRTYKVIRAWPDNGGMTLLECRA